MCAGALIGYLAFPTYPTYDSFYALLWGRDLLHLHLPDFRVYRGPTEHPLAIAFGMLCSIFGQGGRAADGARLDRLVRGRRRRHVPAGAPVLRPGRGAGRRAAAAEPVLHREPRRPGLPGHHLRGADRVGGRARGRTPAPRRAGAPHCSPRPGCCAQTRGCLAARTGCGARGPRGPSAPRDPRARRRSPGPCGASRWRRSRRSCGWRSTRSSRAIPSTRCRRPRASRRNWNAPRGSRASSARCGPMASASTSSRSCSAASSGCHWPCGWRRGGRSCRWRRSLLLFGVYVAEGAVGASVVDRYLLGAATALLPFCAVTVGGWSMLEPGSWLRGAWIAGAVAARRLRRRRRGGQLSLSSLRLTLAEHEDFHEASCGRAAQPRR